jgi:RAD51-like protein 1
MANRKLRFMGFDPQILKVFDEHKLSTCKDLLSRISVELLQELDLPFPLLQEIILKVSRKIAPPMLTVEQLVYRMNAEEILANRLPTYLPAVDAYLRNGIPTDSITEIVGPSGVGKTQLAHQLVVSALLKNVCHHNRYESSPCVQKVENDTKNGQVVHDVGSLFDSKAHVIYFDSENTFSTQRIYEMARAKEAEYFAVEEHLIDLIERVIIFSSRNMTEFLTALSSIESTIIEKNVKFIVVDSIASLIRKEFDNNAVAVRQGHLSKIAAILKRYAEIFHIPVVVTNHVLGTGLTTTAALGPLWSHCVNTRLVLEYFSDFEGKQNVRRLTIAKSPVSPVVSFVYQVTCAGLELIKQNNEVLQHAESLTPDKEYVMEIANGNFWCQTIQSRPRGIPIESQHHLITGSAEIFSSVSK